MIVFRSTNASTLWS